MNPVPLIDKSFQTPLIQPAQNLPQRPQTGISWETIRKTIGVVLIILLIFGVFIPPVMANPQRTFEDTQIQCPNSFQSQGPPECLQSDFCGVSSNAVHTAPIVKFPTYLPKVMHPGLMAGEKGLLCEIPKDLKLPTFKSCDVISKFVVDFVKKNQPEKYVAAIEDKNGRNEKGITFSHGLKKLPIQKVTIGMDFQKVTNFEKALAYIERTVFSNLDSLENDEQVIINAIKTTNKILLKKFSENAGEYRKGAVLVFGGNSRRNNLSELLRQKKGTAEDQEHLNSFLKKLATYEIVEEAFEKASADELRVLEKIVYIPPRSNEIDDQMITFAKGLREAISSIRNHKCNAIVAAALTHQEIVRIHPFEDANGRTARIWMNTILQIGGEKSVIFPDEEEYDKAVAKDQSSPGKFSSYLVKVIEWNKQQDALLIE